MSLIRFDAAGCISAEFGITRRQIDELAEPLTQLRDRFTQIPGTSFFRCPEFQHAAYLADRQNSPLGRIFKTANGLHDHLDAVVVIGPDDATLGPRAMRDACCDPYHNELSRAARGSKPRMYFIGDRFDNDAIASLIHRLSQGGYGDSPSEKRWAIVVIDPVGDPAGTMVTFEPLLSALAKMLGNEAETWLPRLILPITTSDTLLHRRAIEIGCHQIFDSEHSSSDRESNDRVRPFLESVLAPIGMLPAAMLGLDCIRLLEGAAAINEHFLATAYDDNLVLQTVAVQSLIGKHRNNPIRMIREWSGTLAPVRHWHDRLVNSVHDDAPHQGKIVNHILVDQDRHDAISVDDQIVTQLNRRAWEEANQQLTRNQCPTTTTHFPTIDTHVLGQWFQMSLIQAVLEPTLFKS